MSNEVNQQLAKVVQAYHMPAAAKKLVKSSGLVVICGVTAAGKNTIVNYLIEHSGFAYMVSHTTRAPRVNAGKPEQDGRDYWFVDEAKMLELVQTNAFVEIKQVHHTTFYGTSIMAIEQAVLSGKRPITEIDVQGAQELMAEVPSLRPLFVIPPSYDVWLERLANRGALSPEEQAHRFASARAELKLAIDDERFLIVVNRDFHDTVAEIMQGVDDSPKTQAARRDLTRQLLAHLSDASPVVC